jgi:1-acyl-sn-glycerol-3-phosphate acyltransferase
MLERLSRDWRVARTGSAFAFFFGGGALLAGALPAARRLGGDPAGFDLRAQRWIARGYRLFMGYMQLAGLALVRFEGDAARLSGPGPLLVVANHPTLVDTPLLGQRMPQADCIANPDWADNPLLSGAIAAANYVRNDAGAEAIEEGVRRLRQGRRLLIFPEGTRTPLGVPLGPLRRGAAHIALRAGVDLTPVAITCRPRTLMKGQRWHEVPDRAFELTVRVLPPLAAKQVLAGDETASIAARKLTAALEARLLAALEGEARP